MNTTTKTTYIEDVISTIKLDLNADREYKVGFYNTGGGVMCIRISHEISADNDGEIFFLVGAMSMESPSSPDEAKAEAHDISIGYYITDTEGELVNGDGDGETVVYVDKLLGDDDDAYSAENFGAKVASEINRITRSEQR